MRWSVEHHQITTNGIRLHVVQSGPATGPLVLLLHGFPEFWYGWRHQLTHLANAGYRVWAPDQRGYNRSDKPPGIAAYRLELLAADVLGLIEAAGQEKARIVGHDWGGVVTWWIASHASHRLERAVVINAPHGAVMRRHLRSCPSQWLRSWYVGFFQLPWLPELVSRMDHWRLLVRALQESSRPGTFTTTDLEQYRQAWARPQAYRAMLNWYRAIVQKPPDLPVYGPIIVPILLIWGAQDVFLGRRMAHLSIALCPEGQLAIFEEGSHWVHHEEPARVNVLIDRFLRAHSAS
jgi:pimeloyl-ACP methyl ester carboxylesterase